MSNIKGFEMSVRDYAKERGKTVQAVYQQMKRKENAVALNGHIKTRRIGNKDVKYLDEKAVAILDEGSNATPTIIVQTETEEKLAEANQKLEALKFEYMKLQGRSELLQEQLAEKDQKLLQLEEKAKETELLEGFIQDAKAEIEVQKAENAHLSAENKKKDELLLEAEKKAQELSEELERVNNRGFFKRLFNK